jgi:hypothetical protein
MTISPHASLVLFHLADPERIVQGFAAKKVREVLALADLVRIAIRKQYPDVVGWAETEMGIPELTQISRRICALTTAEVANGKVNFTPKSCQDDGIHSLLRLCDLLHDPFGEVLCVPGSMKVDVAIQVGFFIATWTVAK